MNKNRLESLLTQWEETYKKGLLSFWLLLLLSKRKAYPREINKLLSELSMDTINADDNSIYRALNRLANSGLVESEKKESNSGPDRRYFSLTDLGRSLLGNFIKRNIMVFNQPAVSEIIRENCISDSKKERKER